MDNSSNFVGNNRLLAGMVLGVLTFWLFYQSVFNVVPAIQKDLGISDTSLNAVIGIGSLFSGCFIVLMGGLADRFGRVRFTYLGFFLNILACVILFFSRDVVSFGVGRVFQGLAAACIMPATLSLIKTYYHGAERQKAFSFWSIGSFGGSGLASFVGGAVATAFGWKSIFVLSVIVSLVGAFLVRGTPESRSADVPKRYDYVGLFSFVVGLFALNLLIAKGVKWGLSGTTAIMAVLLVLCAAVFLVTGNKLKEQAFLDFSLFKNRAFSGVCVSNLLLNCLAGTILVSNVYLQKGHGLTAMQTGIYSLAYVTMLLLTIRVSEKLIKKLGYKTPMWVGTLITGLGVVGLSMTMLPFDSYVMMIVLSLGLFGFGLGFYATPAADCAMVNVPQDKAAVGAAVFKMTSALGASFGIASGATLFTILQGSMDIHTAARYTFLAIAMMAFLAVVVTLTLIPKQVKVVD